MDKQPSVQQLREEMAMLDEQIAAAKQVQSIVEDERKPIYSLYKWDAPERVFEKKTKQWYVTMAAISLFVIVISALTNNFVFIFVVIAMMMLMFALNTVPPRKITHEITNKGINIFGGLHRWNETKAFWVTERGGHTLINFEFINDSNDEVERTIILQGEGDIKQIVNNIVQHVDYLSAQELGSNPLRKWIDGVYMPLLSFIEEGVITKDPQDAAHNLRHQPNHTSPITS